MAVAAELVPHMVYQRNLGSGEGLVTSYQCKDDDHPSGTRESVFFMADEIDNVAALGGRTGSTLLGTLRSAFSGEALGFSYATKGRDFHLEPQSYRLVMICSVQPRKAGALLNDDAGGTPQRFMWFPATDTRVRRRRGRVWITPLALPSPGDWLYPRTIQVPQVLEDEIMDHREAVHAGTANPLDGHALFCREKFAFALAMFEGRSEILVEDWKLAGVASNVSSFIRQSAVDAIREEVLNEAVARGMIRGVEMESADVEKLQAKIQRGERVLGWMLRKLDTAGEAGIGQAAFAKMVAGRDRETFKLITERGHETLRSELGDDGQLVWYRR